MAQVRKDIYDLIMENDIDDVVFQDPFQEEARKAKRNLVAAGFASILIAALDVHIKGFLGIEATTPGELGASITRGVAFLTVFYFLLAFMFAAFVDYVAWNFKCERILIAPYVDLIQLVEQAFVNATSQVGGAMEQFDNVVNDDVRQEQKNLARAASNALGQLQSISKALAELKDEFNPLMAAWGKTIQQTERLAWRLRARFVSLWTLDIILPLLLAAMALYVTSDGVGDLVSKVRDRMFG